MREWIHKFVTREHAWESVVEQLGSRKDLVSSYQAQRFSRSLGLHVKFCVIYYYRTTRGACVLRSLFTQPRRGASAV